MDSETEELLLQKLDDLVSDDDVLITISILCEKLGISISESKHILDKYIAEENIYPGKVAVSFLICGILKTGEYSIQVVDSIKLFEKKKLFDVISNEIVYSVQISNCIDFNAIALSEKTNLTENFVPKGSIVGDKCTQRLIKSKELPPPPPQKNHEKQKPSSFFKPVGKTESDGDKKESQATSTSSTITRPQKKPGGLAGFLSQTPNDQSKQQLCKASSEEDIRETKRPRMESNGEGSIKQEPKKESEDNERENVNTEAKTEDNGSSKESRNGKAADSKKVKKVKNQTKPDGKKRKRIILQSDSEDDIFANDEEEKMDVDSEEEKPTITKPKDVVPKNKRRQAVEKVYTDEDGYVVTKTEFVLVSASEDEEEVKEEKPKKSDDKVAKKSPPQKSTAKTKKGKAIAANQPTLMNFFKKK